MLKKAFVFLNFSLLVNIVSGVKAYTNPNISYKISVKDHEEEMRRKRYLIMSNSEGLEKKETSDNARNDEKIRHKVSSGESLYAIARKYSTSVEKLIEINNLTSDSVLKAGKELIIPVKYNYEENNTESNYKEKEKPLIDSKSKEVPSNTNLSSSEVKISSNTKNEDLNSDKKEKETTYVVQPGDNLFKISKTFGVKIDKIKSDNNIQNNSINVGQKLIIKSSSGEVVNLPLSEKSEKIENVSDLNSSNSQELYNINVLSAKNYDIKSIFSEKVSKCGDRVGFGNFNIPLEGLVVSKFGDHYQGFKEDTITIQSTKDAVVSSVRDGVVKAYGKSTPGYGNFVVIKHDGDFISIYAHLKDVVVKEDDVVKMGQKIGYLDQDSSNLYKLLFAVRSGRKAINPLYCFKSNQ